MYLLPFCKPFLLLTKPLYVPLVLRFVLYHHASFWDPYTASVHLHGLSCICAVHVQVVHLSAFFVLADKFVLPPLLPVLLLDLILDGIS
jgi:hypothetical protein